MRTNSALHRLSAPAVPMLLLALTALCTACGVSTQAVHRPTATPSSPPILYLSALIPPASSIASAQPTSVVYALDAQTGKQIWQVKAASLVSQTSLSGDTLYMVTTASTSSSTPSSSTGAPSGTVSALNARTGEQRWSRQTGVQVSAIVATNSAVLVAETTTPLHATTPTSPTAKLVALGATDGKPLWTSASYQGAFPTFPLVIFGTTAYLITAALSSTAPNAVPISTVTALNTADGTQRWQVHFSLAVGALVADTQLVGLSGAQSPVSVNSLPATTLMALNPTDGTTTWHKQVPSFVTSLTVDQDALYAAEFTPSSPSAGAPGSRIIAFSGTDGTERWSISTADITPGLAVSGTTLITSLNPISSGTANVLALNTSDGSQVWKMPGAGAPLTAPTVATGTVYVAGLVAATGTTSMVEALSTSTGSLQWQVQVNGLVQSSCLFAV